MKRNRLRIIHDILEAIYDNKNNILPTHILYKANLSYPILQNYLEELLLKQFLEEKHKKSRTSYSLTEKGFAFLDRYGMIDDFAKTFDLVVDEKDY